MSDQITYIHEGIEVILTGRTADRKLKTSSKYTKNPRVDTLHEITPHDKEVGAWKKWVRLTDLYEINSD